MQIIADPKKYTDKEQLYFEVRNKEGRIITDDLLRLLPYVPQDNPYKSEWNLRAKNFEKFVAHLKSKNKSLNILDIGCGNGWMTNRLNKEGHKITGLDLNMAELLQAEKVFGESDTLQWVYADVMTDTLPADKYDIILFSASCQYFADVQQLTNKVSEYLHTGGEIHFTDSIFYKNPADAKMRSLAYYTKLGYADMAAYYHHHSVQSLKDAGYEKIAPGFFQQSVLQWWMYTKK